jgi:hypothetical protein
MVPAVLDKGSTYRATLAVYDASGALADPLSATCTITLPDGSTASPPVTLPPAQTGKLIADYVTTQEGLHKVAWLTGTPGTAAVDYFSVRDYVSVISMAEAKAHLNITSTADDDELRNFLMAATELVENRAGTCVRRTFTERVSQGGRELVLARRPVISVALVKSVWPGGPQWTTAQLITDGEAGIVSQAYLWNFWYGPWDVTYDAGRAVLAERHLHAAKEQLRHLWETQRGAVQAPPLAGDETFTTSWGFAFSVPRRVAELLAADEVPSI